MSGYASFSRVFPGHVDQNGKPHIADREDFDRYCLQLRGKRFNLTIEEFKEIRSNSANAYYWAVIVPIVADWAGYANKEEAHTALKMKFLQKRVEGKPTTLRSTSTMSKEEFAEYLDQCIAFCAESGLVVPEPGEIKIEP